MTYNFGQLDEDINKVAWDRMLSKRTVFHDKRDSSIIMNELYDELYRFVDYDSPDTHALTPVAYNPMEATPNGYGYKELVAEFVEKELYHYIELDAFCALPTFRRLEFIEGVSLGHKRSKVTKAALKLADELRRNQGQ